MKNLSDIDLYTPSVSISAVRRSIAPIPIQSIVGASVTHSFCNEQARIILQADGHVKAAGFFQRFTGSINAGARWADRGWRSFAHHYDPTTGTGLKRWPNALEKCEEYFKKALRLWYSGKPKKAMFMLGAAAHLVQDMCVPHHASCKVFEGHQQFEKWAKKRRRLYAVKNGGLYDLGRSAGDWIIENARFSQKYLNHLKPPVLEWDYHAAAQALLPRAQRSTSGLLYLFYLQVNR